MSITASMWTGVSGLLNHGQKMSVIGNNIANVNTIGFKGARMDFEDFLFQDVPCSNGFSQVGRGVTIGAVIGDFSQGALETSNSVTDIAIAGKGMFKVKPRDKDESFYTRAGNFNFNAEGYLADPHNYALQGWEIPTTKKSLIATAVGSTTTSAIKGTGVPKDIRMDNFTCEPSQTQSISLMVNLPADAVDKSTSLTDPFLGLMGAWNGAAVSPAVPLAESQYGYSTSIEVYDEAGSKHVLTVYYDKVEDNTTNADPSQQHWEFIVTMNPAEDRREINGVSAAGERAQGLLMTGTMTFDNAGLLQDMSAYTPNLAHAAAGDWDNAANWTEAPLSRNGYPMLSPNFSGLPNASSPIDTDSEAYLVELNFGVKSRTPTWSQNAGTSAATILTDHANLIGFGNSAQRTKDATTCYEGSASEYKRFQDGYSFGHLQNVSISEDGVVSGRYSNGITLPLWQIALYDFPSYQGLRREGGNLFSQTQESGEAVQGAAASAGFGATKSYSIEVSNVDLAKEFVQMITTQRGYQSNSKVVTTVDTMLETVIQMKR